MNTEQYYVRMKNFLHILCIIGLVLLLYSCSGGPRVIPRGKMAKIYAEMLLTDQWINSTPSVMRMADTSLVYEPILEKYGYNSADYRRSVEHYMDDPERYSRILRSTSEILGHRLDELNDLKKAMEDAIVVIKTNFAPEDYFPYLFKEPYIHYYDSLSVETDTLGCYRMISIERSDTVYDGLKMIIQPNSKIDSLSVADSLDVIDSLAVGKRLATGDSLAVMDSIDILAPRKKCNDLMQVDTSLRRVSPFIKEMEKEPVLQKSLTSRFKQ